MSADRNVWENVYRKQRQLWAGTPADLPDLPPASRVLELGSGNARTCARLLEHGWDVIALDFALPAVRICNERILVSELGYAVLADARNLPFREECFSAVFARHIIGHMDPAGRSRIAREISRVLSPGGYCYFSGFSRNDFRYQGNMSDDTGTREVKSGIRTHYFTKEEVRSLFSSLICISIMPRRWELKVRGRLLPREEIHAVFCSPVKH